MNANTPMTRDDILTRAAVNVRDALDLFRNVSSSQHPDLRPITGLLDDAIIDLHQAGVEIPAKQPPRPKARKMDPKYDTEAA